MLSVGEFDIADSFMGADMLRTLGTPHGEFNGVCYWRVGGGVVGFKLNDERTAVVPQSYQSFSDDLVDFIGQIGESFQPVGGVTV